jgi:glycosyltransferase involved in cell wall biosynthesis
VGATSEPDRYFQAADLFLLPTREDPWGLTLIEAMAAGTPSVTYDAAGASTVVAESGAGVVLPAGHRGAFRTTVARLAASHDERRVRGARGRAAAHRFGPAAHAEQLVDVYRGVLERRQSKAA